MFNSYKSFVKIGEILPDMTIIKMNFLLIGYEYEEIADMVGIPVGTVKSRISRARGKLAGILKNMGTF